MGDPDIAEAANDLGVNNMNDDLGINENLADLNEGNNYDFQADDFGGVQDFGADADGDLGADAGQDMGGDGG